MELSKFKFVKISEISILFEETNGHDMARAYTIVLIVILLGCVAGN